MAQTTTPRTATTPADPLADADRALFMQLQVFSGCVDPAAAREALAASGLEGVVYLDANDPQGIGVLIMTEDPQVFVGAARELLGREPFTTLSHKPALTMMGRTYAIGHEADRADWLLQRPRRQTRNPARPWAIWYPLRRTGAFALLESSTRAKILSEHAKIGRAYGEAGHASDIRLACHGLDVSDNDFVIGLVGPALAPLSRLIEDMRATQQTARYIESLGPFFVGRAIWQHPLNASESAAT